MVGSIDTEVDEDEGYCIKDTVSESIQLIHLIYIRKKGRARARFVVNYW